MGQVPTTTLYFLLSSPNANLMPSAAAATTHLFFAYLRSLAPDNVIESTVSKLSRSLQALLAQTEYPPETPVGLLNPTSKVVMVVTAVSPTPFAMLRRAKNFDYNEDALQTFSDYDDPVQALTAECRRVLEAISSSNSTHKPLPEVSAASPTSPKDESWMRFEDMGFSSLLDGTDVNGSTSNQGQTVTRRSEGVSQPGVTNLGRPATPSWADFMSEGFSDDSSRAPDSLLLPPQQLLPPLSPGRVQSSQSHVKGIRDDGSEPGELAGVTRHDMDETFWWVWMASLAHEEPVSRKSVFGRCAFVETNISSGRWLVVEEQVKGAAPVPQQAVIAPKKKSRFASFTARGRERRSSMGQPPPVPSMPYENGSIASKTTIGPDQQAKVQAAAAALVRQRIDEEEEQTVGRRRGRTNEQDDAKTVSVMTLGLQPGLAKEAGPALQWARKFDKEGVRQQYLGDNATGKGLVTGVSPTASTVDLQTAMSAGDATSRAQRDTSFDRDLPPLPNDRGMTAADFLSQNAPPRAPAKDIPIIHSPAETGSSMDAVKNIQDHGTNATSPSALSQLDGPSSTIAADTPSRTVNRKPISSFGAPKLSGATNQTRRSGDQQQPTTPKPSPAVMAARAASQAMRTSNESLTKSPPRSGPPPSKGLKNMFNKRKTQDPETLAAQRTTNGSSLSVEKSHLSRTSSFLRRKQVSPKSSPNVPAIPDSAAVPVATQPAIVTPAASTQASSAADDAARIRETHHLRAPVVEPEPEVSAYDSHELSPYPNEEPHEQLEPSTQFTSNANESSAQFSNFTQGPLDDVPAFIPDEEPTLAEEVVPSQAPSMPASAPVSTSVLASAPAPATPSTFQTRAAAFLAPERSAPQAPQSEVPVSPAAATLDSRNYEEAHSSNSTNLGRTPTATSVELPAASPSAESITALPTKPVPTIPRQSVAQPQATQKPETAADRWAQIRQNAAERRKSEEQRNRSHSSTQKSQSPSVLTDKTDDGETSGEESKS